VNFALATGKSSFVSFVGPMVLLANV